MIERVCDEISWRNVPIGAPLIKKGRRLQVFSTLSEWHPYCLSLCVMHRSEPEPVAQFQRPPRGGGSDTAIRNTIVGTDSGTEDNRLSAFLPERLSPAERAVYVLREAFDYSYREIATILRLEEANSRQLVSRARRHVADGRHATVDSAEPQRFLAAFLAAAHDGVLPALESFFVGVAHGPVGRTSRQHGLDRRSARALQYPDLANRWTLPPQRDVKVAESCSGGDLAPWSTLTRNPLADDELLECIQIAVGE
jgi:Sigma-70, region 4